MRFGRFARAFAPIAAVALAAALAGCDGANVQINGEEGKLLSELDLSGTPPTELVLLGPDEVRVTTGDKLAITLEGDTQAQAALRFTLKDGALGVLRKDKWFGGADKLALVKITMPPPTEVTMAGSGKVTLGALAKEARINIAGSGTIEATAIDSDSLDATIAGSGSLRGAGTARKLKLDVVGSGSAALDALKVDSAKVTIAGSGDTAFMSDGEVSADIIGSGEVRVKGRARCKVSSMGSGRLVCESGAVKEGEPEAPEAPEAPKAP